MTHSMQTSRKGSSIYEEMTSRTSSGFGEESFSFRPDTAPGNPREQTLPISPLALGERSKSVPRNMRMPERYMPEPQPKLSSREILQGGRLLTPVDVQDLEKVRPKTVQPKVEETLRRDQPWYMSMLREKEERLLQMGDEINRLNAFETEAKQKENEIFDLKRQLAQYLATKTTQEVQNESIILDLKKRNQLLSEEVVRFAHFEEETKKKDEVIRQLEEKLAYIEEQNLKPITARYDKDKVDSSSYADEAVSVASDTIEKTETGKPKGVIVGGTYDEQVKSIQESLKNANDQADALREKFDSMVPEKLTPEDEVTLLRDDLTKKTRLVEVLQEKLDAMQKELSVNEGFVNALQRDLQASENKVMKLISQVEKAEAKKNEAVVEAQAMSKKFSDLRESRKHSDMAAENEHELTLLKAAFSEAQTKIEKMEEKIEKQGKEIRDSHRRVKKGNELDKKQSDEIKNLCRDLEDMRRREQLSRVATEQISSRFERLRSRIIQAVYVTPGAALPSTVISDVIVFNAVKKIIEDRSEFHKKLEETVADFPPLLVELDATHDEDKPDEVTTTVVPSPERKSGKGGRKSPKHR